MKKRILAVIIAAAAVFAFSACKEEKAPVSSDVPESAETENVSGSGEEQSEEADESGEIDYESGLSTERYDGYEYRMFVRKGMAHHQYLEEDSEDIIESATYRRNKMVEEKYGITITASESSGSYETDALNAILAGDDAYDIIFPHSRAAFTYAIQGAAVNIHEIESIHLDKPWWSRNVDDNCTVNGKLYVLDGDISYTSLSSAMAMFFNKNIFDELGFDYPYETVKDGDWTFDEFAYYAKKGGADLNGDGVIKGEDDRFGFVTREWEAPINILYASGEKIYDKNDEGILELTLYSNKTVDVFDEFFSLMNNEACFMIIQEGSGVYTGSDPFQDGRAMIMASCIGDAAKYRNMDDDFGIIPYPKFDEEDEYATAINGVASLAVIPITVTDVERTGAITEALAAYSSKEVLPAFYEKSLKSKYSRDEESEEMLDLIRDSIVFDLGYLAGGPFNSIGRELALSTNKDFASAYASKESSALQSLENFNRDYGAIED